MLCQLPEIGQFLFLCAVPLKLVGEVTQSRLERCLLMPRESATLRLIMSSLLSTEKRRLTSVSLVLRLKVFEMSKDVIGVPSLLSIYQCVVADLHQL